MSVELIGINGSMLESKYKEIKNNPSIDPVCYTGTLQECLMEFAGRECYLSGFKGKSNRPTLEYFKNIKDSFHTSVFAHSMIQVRLPLEDARKFAFELCNEPGWYFSFTGRPQKASEWVLVTMNFRFLERLQDLNYRKSNILNHLLSDEISNILDEAIVLAQVAAPCLFGETTEGSLLVDYSNSMRKLADLYQNPGNNEWYSFRITGSRSWSHEHIRHSFESAISQQSTRFCEMSEHEFLRHPLEDDADYTTISGDEDNFHHNWKLMYNQKFKIVQIKLEKSGVDKFRAKKQARGAAARYLPHGVETSMVYTASLREWRTIFDQRISDHADEEIREITTLCRNELLDFGCDV